MRTPLNDLAKQIEAGTLHIQVGKIFHHRRNCRGPSPDGGGLDAGGKIVVLT